MKHLKKIFFNIGVIEIILFITLITFKVGMFYREIDYLHYLPVIVSIIPTFFWSLALYPISDKKRKIMLLLSNIFLSFILLVDLLHWRFFDDIFSLFSIYQINQVGEIKCDIFRLLKFTDILFILDIVILVFLLFKPLKTNGVFSQKNRGKFVKISWFLVLLVLSFYGNMTFINVSNQTFDIRNMNEYIAKNIGIFNYHFYDGIYLLKNMGRDMEVSQDQWDEIDAFFKYHDIVNKNHPLYGIAKNKNLIIIQEESLQNFVVNMKIQNQEITPNFNELIKNSIYYNNFYNQTHYGHSSDSEFSSLTSLYPIDMGSVNCMYPGNDYDSLTKVLKENGYSTLSAHGYRRQFWNRETMHKTLGFEKSMFTEDFHSEEKLGWGIPDHIFFKESILQLKELDQPFFAYLITLTNHTPFVIDDKYKELNLGDLEGTLLGDYFHSVHYVDHSLGIFMDYFKKTAFYKESIVVIYGDHKSELPEDELKRLFPLLNNYEKEKINKVPFIISIPFENISYTSEKISGHLDVTPTLLHLLGIEPKNSYFMGYNLFKDYDDKIIVFPNGSFLNDDFYFITDNGSYDDGTCYELSKETILDKKMAKNSFHRAADRYKISNLIIKGNLIPKLKGASKN